MGHTFIPAAHTNPYTACHALCETLVQLGKRARRNDTNIERVTGFPSPDVFAEVFPRVGAALRRRLLCNDNNGITARKERRWQVRRNRWRFGSVAGRQHQTAAKQRSRQHRRRPCHRELPVPQNVRVTLSDVANHELYSWSFTPSVQTLKPGQAVPFLTRLSSPPGA